jgi:hypothetical protein
MLKVIERQDKNRIERQSKKDYKLIVLPSDYNPKHKNTFNSYNKAETVYNTDYTLKMLKKFMPVQIKIYSKDRVIKNVAGIDYNQKLYALVVELV